jgi:hypothetical protein
MAEIVETVERDGVLVNVYASGLERNAANGHFIKPPPHTLITKENATVLVRKRQEKQAALLRSAIRREHNAKMSPIANSSAAVFAESGALLYSEIVLNADAYPRDRLEAWQVLGKAAQVLADPKDKDAAPTAGAAEAISATTELVRLLREVVKPVRADVPESASGIIVDGKVTDE